MVKKIETHFRSELAQDTTCALFSVKMNTDVRPAAFVPGVGGSEEDCLLL